MDRQAISQVISFLATLTVAGQIILIILLFLLMAFLAKVKNKNLKKFISLVSNNAFSFSLLIATIATLGSLFFSEVGKFPPCKLCWYQRIFMYPQVIILGVGMLLNDTKVRIYSIILSSIGFAIAIYHYALQMYPTVLPCSDEIASCSAKQFAYFGYITIPLMSATAFGLILLIQLTSWLYTNYSSMRNSSSRL